MWNVHYKQYVNDLAESVYQNSITRNSKFFALNRTYRNVYVSYKLTQIGSGNDLAFAVE